MYDPRGKKRDLRRGMVHGFSPHRYYWKIHSKSKWRFGNCNCETWEECCNKEVEFIREWTGCDYWDAWGHSHAPASFRRLLNRKYKAQCKAALRKAVINWDWDNYLPPLHADDADYIWF